MPILFAYRSWLIGILVIFGMALALAFRPINIYQLIESGFLSDDNKKLIMIWKSYFLEGLYPNFALILVPSFILLYFILPWLTAFYWDMVGVRQANTSDLCYLG